MNRTPRLNLTPLAMLVTLCPLIAALGSSPPAAAQTASAPASEETEATSHVRRVIVHESRRREVQGFVEFEDEAMLFLRHRDGKLERFVKDRVVSVVRLVDPLPDQRGIVFLRNGLQRTGVILEDTFDQVVLDIEGVRSVVPRDMVDHVRLHPTFEEQYRRFKELLRPEMVESHLGLCQWLVDQKKYDLAEAELDELLRNHPSGEGEQLLRVVAAHQALAKQPAQPVPPPTEPKPRVRRTTTEPRGPILSQEDVNLIRVYEIDFRRPPNLDVPRETIERLLASYASSPLVPTTPAQRKALFRAEPIHVVEELIFKLQARELYGEIEVLSEPYALNEFRQRVHNGWLINNCSTSHCHGGPDSGRFFLHRRNHKNERVRYTNLLILERLEVDPEWKLIDYEKPLDSLILQYGLPRPVARKPHPAVRGWKPAFRGTDDRMVRRTVDWIEAMMKPRVRYPVDFDPNAPASPAAAAGDD